MRTIKKRPDRLPALNRFAAALGWPALKRYQRTIELAPRNAGMLVTWYVSGDDNGEGRDFFLQINECPIGQRVVFAAAVYAPRFRLCSGWHAFRLARTPKTSKYVAALAPWLSKTHFTSNSGRRAYRLLHPETVGYSWKKLRRDGPPYQVGDAQPDRNLPHIRSNTSSEIAD